MLLYATKPSFILSTVIFLGAAFVLARGSDVVWEKGKGEFFWCEEVTFVFNIPVCVTSKGRRDSTREKRDHAVNVFFQLLDNNEDGIVDDSRVHSEMVNKYLLILQANENDWEKERNRNEYMWQPVFLDKVVTDSCDVPVNRGASATDRSTWTDAIDTNDSAIGCTNKRDESGEEILHLIQGAADVVHPKKWGGTYNSEAGAAVRALNGDCGFGTYNNWTDPSTNACSGQYAYNDRTCSENCIVIEGVYWAVWSYIGGLYTKERSDFAKSEWLMATPDASMRVIPSNVRNAISLELGSPVLYALVSDTTSEGNAWLPSVMPNGKYKDVNSPNVLPPTPAPTPNTPSGTVPPTPVPTPAAPTPNIPSGTVLCPGKDPGEYCDCVGDCNNFPQYCTCGAAQQCCQRQTPQIPEPKPACVDDADFDCRKFLKNQKNRGKKCQKVVNGGKVKNLCPTFCKQYLCTCIDNSNEFMIRGKKYKKKKYTCSKLNPKHCKKKTRQSRFLVQTICPNICGNTKNCVN